MCTKLTIYDWNNMMELRRQSTCSALYMSNKHDVKKGEGFGYKKEVLVTCESTTLK